jgi:hypothetical protein
LLKAGDEVTSFVFGLATEFYLPVPGEAAYLPGLRKVADV